MFPLSVLGSLRLRRDKRSILTEKGAAPRENGGKARDALASPDQSQGDLFRVPQGNTHAGVCRSLLARTIAEHQGRCVEDPSLTFRSPNALNPRSLSSVEAAFADRESAQFPRNRMRLPQSKH